MWVGRLFGELFLVQSWMFLYHHLACVVFDRIQAWVPGSGFVGMCFGRGVAVAVMCRVNSSNVLLLVLPIVATQRPCAAGPNLNIF